MRKSIFVWVIFAAVSLPMMLRANTHAHQHVIPGHSPAPGVTQTPTNGLLNQSSGGSSAQSSVAPAFLVGGGLVAVIGGLLYFRRRRASRRKAPPMNQPKPPDQSAQREAEPEMSASSGGFKLQPEPSASPRPATHRAPRGWTEGEARDVSRQPGAPHKDEELSFRLVVFNERHDEVMQLPIRMRGRHIDGDIKAGDRVAIKSRPKSEADETKLVKNLSTGFNVSKRRMSGCAVAFLIVFLIAIVGVIGSIVIRNR